MNWREKLADWISGGALARARDAYCETQYERDHFFHTLRDIAACETPKANATVKRMARIAREALE